MKPNHGASDVEGAQEVAGRLWMLSPPAPPHGVRPIIETAAQRASLAPPQVVADSSSISILRTSLLAGMELPLMPLKAEIDAGLLQATPVASPPLDRVLALCHSAHIPCPPPRRRWRGSAWRWWARSVRIRPGPAPRGSRRRRADARRQPLAQACACR
ncbi:MAG: hypothetical protein KGZ67_09475, partial [Hydrogenophaga sp.]|nr:hypothetical protein [Hydrogenophaga sp.]